MEDSVEVTKEALSNIDNFVIWKISHAIIDIVVNLYCFDYEGLKRDIAKIVLLDDCYIVSNQDRFNLLRALFPSIKKYYEDDVSDLLNECQRVITYQEECNDDENLPFI